ncbi:hypothetical protein [Photorhabdus luminescens]|uniref:hypothetical protein n=1 Tax=Photorhabdus luminescens TaxID=29488 RepID=UPI00223EBA2B|nr:hypothetical protein [Photorhabdus luminescens]MCW7763475.1 hypothetical protein [Photorhabdus luminescens subsp. venezuelensis]
MNITLSTTTHRTFEMITVTDKCFLLKTAGSDLVFQLFHKCMSNNSENLYPCYEDGSPAFSFGLFSPAEIEKAWNKVLDNMIFFLVEIRGYVGDMKFPIRSICCAPSFYALYQHLDKEMFTWRGEGEYNEDTDMWDYRDISADVPDVWKIDREAAKSALRHGLLPFWLWV